MDWMKRYVGVDMSRVAGRNFTVKYRDDDGGETIRVGVMTVNDDLPCTLVLDCGKDGFFGVFLCSNGTIDREYADVESVVPFFSNGGYEVIEDAVYIENGDILFVGDEVYHASGEISLETGTVNVREDAGEIDLRLLSKALRYTEPPKEDGLYFDTEGRLWMKDLMWYRVDVDNRDLVEIPNNQTPGSLPLEPMDYAKWTKGWTREKSS